MQFSTKISAPEKLRTGCAVLAVVNRNELTAGGQAIDRALDGRLSRVLAGGDLAEKPGSTLMVAAEGGIERVLLVSMGAADESGALPERGFVDAARAAMRELSRLAPHDAASLLSEAPLASRGAPWKARHQVIAAQDAAYRFDRMKSQREQPARGARSLALLVDRRDQAAVDKEVGRAQAICEGMQLAKDLGNLPGNVCTPTYLADEARRIAKEHKLRCEVLDAKQMEALKMGALLAVAKGSEQPPKLIVLQYQGAGKAAAPVALVGKGITFDTGGISIKPAAEMDEMKYDMSGAGAVLGTLLAVARMRLPINVVAIVPTCENMPSGRSTRPGDIVESMSGQTIEILNTDAEGRLILADALTYAKRFKPSTVIDVATLTGACVIALGHHNTGLFTRQDALAAELQDAGREMLDAAWRMPLDDEYQEQIKSPFADMANIGGRAAGAVTAACFLSRYAKGYDWAHLDIAGTAWKSGAAKGSTGRPVPLLARFLIARADA